MQIDLLCEPKDHSQILLDLLTDADSLRKALRDWVIKADHNAVSVSGDNFPVDILNHLLREVEGFAPERCDRLEDRWQKDAPGAPVNPNMVLRDIFSAL
jgi:hypothetical protein